MAYNQQVVGSSPAVPTDPAGRDSEAGSFSAMAPVPFSVCGFSKPQS